MAEQYCESIALPPKKSNWDKNSQRCALHGIDWLTSDETELKEPEGILTLPGPEISHTDIPGTARLDKRHAMSGCNIGQEVTPREGKRAGMLSSPQWECWDKTS